VHETRLQNVPRAGVSSPVGGRDWTPKEVNVPSRDSGPWLLSASTNAMRRAVHGD
jgi:hypothetical protein